MSETTHTPGPWRVDTSYELGFNHDGEVAIFAGEAVVAEVWPMGDDAVGDAAQEANANLITAAPDMYEALEAALQVLEGVHLGSCRHMDECICERDAARAALARARGEGVN